MNWERVALNDYFAAWENWVKYPHDDPGKRMMQFIDSQIKSHINQKLSVTPEAAHKIRLLLGPHHQTIIKAWYAKHHLS